MPEFIQVLFFLISFSLALIAYRRAMVSPLTTVVLVCLVTGLVIMTSKNKNLRMSMNYERNLTAAALIDKNTRLENCIKELDTKKSDLLSAADQKKAISDEKDHLAVQVEKLQAEAAKVNEMSKNIEELQGNVNTLKQETEKLQNELNTANQKISNVETEKTSLQNTISDLQKKLEAAEAAKASAELAAKSAAEAAAKAAAVAPAEAPKQAAKPESKAAVAPPPNQNPPVPAA
ncbi:uncharacterized protein [Palaemon carinicauda]|uniref:uncharacterized protein isoform X1 n=2 Tax=Palaemon carinicauda TaxID=392227 RepID=UPI0035B582C4